MKGSRSRGSSAPELEEITLRAFLHPDRVERYVLLLKSVRTRYRAVVEIGQKAPFDPVVVRPLARPTAENGESLVRALQDLGMGTTCYAISEDRSIDGRLCPLEEALWAGIVGSGTLISGAPRLVGCFLGESPNDRYLLVRPSGKPLRA